MPEAVIKTALTDMLGIRYPVIMAPMFLVSNAKMVIEANKAGIAGCIPSLNYRTAKALRQAIQEVKSHPEACIGINLIGNKSNLKLEEHLAICVEEKVDFIITSLGSPRKIIEACKPVGIKVFCDVVDENYAKKVEEMGADALIAVNAEAGGHAGPLLAKDLIPLLLSSCNLPVISAGGVGNAKQLAEKLEIGACGVSVGSPFIATEEADVSKEYKEACVEYGEEDIVMTTKISGTPCTVINTPYVQKIGTKQNWFESLLNKNKSLKKFTKMLTFYKGMKALESAAFSATYKTVWCAGPSIEYVQSIEPVRTVVERLTDGLSKMVKAEKIADHEAS